MVRLGYLGLAALLAGGVSPLAFAQEPTPQPKAESPAVGAGMDVGMEYTLTVEGEVVDSTEGKPPFHYTHGSGEILVALEQQLEGLHTGETKEVVLDPSKGYGQIDPQAFVEIEKSRLPSDVPPEKGMILQGVNPQTNRVFQARVNEVKADSVVLDLNHPLAGKELNFKVKITDVAPASAKTDAGAATGDQPAKPNS